MVSVRHLLFLYKCDVILLKGNMNDPRYGVLARFAFWMKGSECALILSYILCVPALLIKAFSFVLCEMACVFKTRIKFSQIPIVALKKSPVFGNMLSCTRESISRTSYASNFKRLFDPNLRVLTTCFLIVVFVSFSAIVLFSSENAIRIRR